MRARHRAASALQSAAVIRSLCRLPSVGSARRRIEGSGLHRKNQDRKFRKISAFRDRTANFEKTFSKVKPSKGNYGTCMQPRPPPRSALTTPVISECHLPKPDPIYPDLFCHGTSIALIQAHVPPDCGSRRAWDSAGAKVAKSAAQ
jgi:hypothetical protein